MTEAIVRAIFPCIAIAAALSGCAGGPAFQRPDVVLPAEWQSVVGTPSVAPVSPTWWTDFQSQELNRLVAAAIENNRDLKAAASRIAQARALAQIAGANLAPSIGASADVVREKRGGNPRSTRQSASLATSIEPDIWGKNRQSHEAATSRLESSVHAQRAVTLALQAEVATTYFVVLSAQDRLAVAQKNLGTAETLLRLVQAQHRAGAISGLEVARQQSLVASVKADIAPLRQQIQQALNALAVLLGRYPQNLSIAKTPLDSVRLPQVSAGLPSTLLERRPDIQKAETDLAAAQADIDVARAALFPSIKLTASGGGESASLASLLRPSNVVYAFAAGLTAPIFDGGRLRGQLAVAKARQDELLQVYQQSILLALREVEDSLSALQNLADQAAQQKDVVTHATTALRIAELRYRNGAFEFATVVDAQRVLLAAQSTQESITLSRYAATISLYRALGGGWDNVTPTSKISTATQR